MKTNFLIILFFIVGIGLSAQSTQCIGTTRKGLRCKRMTTNTNGYCYQHQGQIKQTAIPSFGSKKASEDKTTSTSNQTSKTRQCKGITKKGLQCKRMTSDPSGYCYQHHGQK